MVKLAYIITKRMLSEKKRIVVHEPNTKKPSRKNEEKILDLKLRFVYGLMGFHTINNHIIVYDHIFFDHILTF